MNRALRSLAFVLPLAAPLAAQDAPLRPPTLHAAWLVDLLQADPAQKRAAYRAVVDDRELPREERLVALARLLPLAAVAPDRADSDALQVRAEELLGRPGEEATRESARRVGDLGSALRGVLRRAPSTPDLAALADTFARAMQAAPAGLRMAGFGSADSLPEVQRRMLRVAEERGDAAEAARLRRLLAANTDAIDARATRQRQIQRWARDAIEAELAGQSDRSARLRAGLRLLRVPGPRGPAGLADRFQRAPERMIRLTTERLEAALAGKGGDGWSDRERDAARRALAESRRRHSLGDVEGATALLWPAALLVRLPD